MDRNKIDERFKWDLSKIYDSKDSINMDISYVKERLEEFSKYDGIIYNADNLYELLSLYMDVSRHISKLEVYASLLCDEDTSINKNLEFKESINNLYSLMANKTYFIDSSILELDYSTIEEFYKENKKLEEYRIYLKEMFRYKEHNLSKEEDKLLAGLSKVFGNNYETYELLKDSDLVFPSFIVDDKEYLLDNSKYSLYLEDNNREVRKNAFCNLYNVYKTYKNVFSNLITSNIKEDVSMANIKKYNSALECSLYHDEVNIDIYNNLIDVVNDKINVLHKYYDLKKKVLNYDELHLYDVYTNLVVDDNFKYEFDKAKDIVKEALYILGDEYVSILSKGIDDRWIDVYPNKGKRTGGYSSGSYDTNPYILLNYQDKYEDMSTLAHELGHSMHSYYTRENNPYQYGYYSIFVAEVASTVNELLLAKYVLKNSNDKNEKLFILNRLMELYRATIYRQTMFAEFERDIYSMIEEDKPLSADILSDKYYELNKVYFGKNVFIDDEIKYEWERIPHFYYNFYVYKYATGLSAASYIVSSLLSGKITKEDYINFLKCGKSKNPLDSLKVAGVDLSKKEVISSAIDEFDKIIDEFTNLYFN